MPVLTRLVSRLRLLGGRWWLLRVVFSPLTVLITTPLRLIQSLANCGFLFNRSEWSNYSHFDSLTGVNSLYYWHHASNLREYGTRGYSPFVGTGNYSMANCCHYCRSSIYAFWKAGAVTVLVSMITWWLTHLVWWPGVSSIYGSVILLITFGSSLFYANLFGSQNYNALGWAAFPLILFASHTGNWALLAVGALAVSFGSLTVLAISAALVFAKALALWDIWPIVAVGPALLKGLLHLHPCSAHGNLARVTSAIAKLIGCCHVNVKYKRRSRTLELGDAYIVVLLAIVVVVSGCVAGELPAIATMALIIILANSSFLRFADHQTSQMLAMSIAVAECMRLESWLMFAGVLPMMSALPVLVRHATLKGPFDVFPVMRPFNVRPLLDRMHDFLADIPSGSRILMAYADPEGKYKRIYDGYRVLFEPIHYAAGTCGIAVIPDWAAIADYNYEGAPGFWGRTPEAVIRNLEQWNCDYAVTYTTDSQRLDESWEKCGFEILSTLDWSDLGHLLENRIPTKAPPPKWWLLRRKS